MVGNDVTVSVDDRSRSCARFGDWPEKEIVGLGCRGDVHDAWAVLLIKLHIIFLIINMRKSEDRHSRMELRLSERGIKHRFIDAIDGDDAATVQAAFTCSKARGSLAREQGCVSQKLRAPGCQARATQPARSISPRRRRCCLWAMPWVASERAVADYIGTVTRSKGWSLGGSMGGRYAGRRDAAMSSRRQPTS